MQKAINNQRASSFLKKKKRCDPTPYSKCNAYALLQKCGSKKIHKLFSESPLVKNKLIIIINLWNWSFWILFRGLYWCCCCFFLVCVLCFPGVFTVVGVDGRPEYDQWMKIAVFSVAAAHVVVDVDLDRMKYYYSVDFAAHNYYYYYYSLLAADC